MASRSSIALETEQFLPFSVIWNSNFLRDDRILFQHCVLNVRFGFSSLLQCKQLSQQWNLWIDWIRTLTTRIVIPYHSNPAIRLRCGVVGGRNKKVGNECWAWFSSKTTCQGITFRPPNSFLVSSYINHSVTLSDINANPSVWIPWYPYSFFVEKTNVITTVNERDVFHTAIPYLVQQPSILTRFVLPWNRQLCQFYPYLVLLIIRNKIPIRP